MSCYSFEHVRDVPERGEVHAFIRFEDRMLTASPSLFCDPLKTAAKQNSGIALAYSIERYSVRRGFAPPETFGLNRTCPSGGRRRCSLGLIARGGIRVRRIEGVARTLPRSAFA